MSTTVMSNLLTPTRIVPQLAAPSKDALLRDLVARLAADAALPERALAEAVADAAALAPFMPRGGVSLLHVLVPGLSKPQAIVARLKHTLELGGGCATDIVVFLASPAERFGDHLRALACLARRLRRPDVLAHLRAAKCRDVMYVALTSDEWCANDTNSSSPWPGRRSGSV